MTKAGSGYTTLTGGSNNTFTAPISINGGYLGVAADVSLGNASNSVSVDNGGGLAVTASFTSARTFNLGNTNGGGVLDVSGAATVLTLSGSVKGPGPLTKFGGGTLVLTNPNNSYQGGTLLSDGTLSISSSGNLGSSAGTIAFQGYGADTTLQFTNSMIVPNDISFPTTSNYCWLDTQGNNVTLAGQLWPTGTRPSLSIRPVREH